VRQSSETSGEGLPVTCFASSLLPLPDRSPRDYKWCFDNADGLLRSADVPLGIHVAFSKYVIFEGKYKYTHVTATAGKLRLLDANITYSPLAAGALAQLTPAAGMKRRDAPEDPAEKRVIAYQPLLQEAHAPLPKGEPLSEAGEAVSLRILNDADGIPIDAGVEEAPDEAMAQAALNVVHDYRFQQLASRPMVPTRILVKVRFHAADDETIAAIPRMQLKQVREVFAATGVHESTERMAKKQILAKKDRLPPWWPTPVLAQMEEAAAQVDPAPIDLPFFQQCYSERDGRLAVDVMSTPEGRDWSQYALGFSLEEQQKGVTAPDAVNEAIKSRPIPPTILEHLDPQDLAYARETLTPEGVAAEKACMSSVSAKAIGAVQAVQLDAMKKVMDAHRQELEAARAAYEAQNKGVETPR
jgi:hypothetical protein